MTEWKEECASNKGHTYIQWLIALTANLSVLTYGLQIGWVSPMSVILQSDLSPTGNVMSTTAISWIGSITSLAASFGVQIFGYLADSYGRKAAVLALSVPQALCWLLKLSSANTTIIVIARIFSGLSAGGCYVIVPMYVKEISQDNIRGILVSLVTMSQNMGVLIMYILGTYLSYFVAIYSVIWLPLLTFLLLLKAPESPAYLMKIGKVNEATAITASIRGLHIEDGRVIKEIESLKNQDLQFKSLPNVSFISILKNSVWRRSFLIAIALMTTHACNGSFTIIVFASSIIINSGSNFSPELSFSFPLISILAASISMNCIDRFGRKPILCTCFTMMTVAMTCIGTVVLIQHHGGTVPFWIPLTAMMMAVAGHAAGPLAVAFVVLSEMFNFQVRAKLMGFNVSYTWFMNFIQLFIFAPISDSLGLYTAFYIYAVFNVLAMLFSLIILPETKGKSIEEIEEHLKKKYNLKN